MGKFHYRDDWYFERLEDDSVRIGWAMGAIYLDIDPDSWAAIVASVSKERSMNGRQVKQLRKKGRKEFRKQLRELKESGFVERVALAWWLLFGKR
jgi:hypothetical protein